MILNNKYFNLNRSRSIVEKKYTDLKDPKVSPLYGNFTGFPPLLFLVGSNEILLSDSLRAASNARN